MNQRGEEIIRKTGFKRADWDKKEDIFTLFVEEEM
jgi:hypothetical protein